MRKFNSRDAEIADTAENTYKEYGDCCPFCHYFNSYAEEYDDLLEPADCGTCGNNKSTLFNDHVSATNKCNLFVYWEQGLEI